MRLSFGHLESLTRSPGQIKEKPCGRSRGQISCSIELKFSQIVCLDEIPELLYLDHLGQKLGHKVKLNKYLVGALEASFLAQLT